MTITQLRYIFAVLRFQSTAKAAKHMHISQSGVSKAINRLEAEVGFQILTYHGQRIALTAKGQKWLPSATKALKSFDQLEIKTKEIADEAPKIIKVGMLSPSIELYQKIGDFQQTNHAQFALLSDLSSKDILSQVSSGDLDLGLTVIDWDSLKQYPRLSYQLVCGLCPRLFVPLRNRLSHQSHINHQDLRKQKFIRLQGDMVSDHLYRQLGQSNTTTISGNLFSLAYQAYRTNAVFISTDLQFKGSALPMSDKFKSLSLKPLVDQDAVLVWLYRKNYHLSAVEAKLLKVPVPDA